MHCRFCRQSFLRVRAGACTNGLSIKINWPWPFGGDSSFAFDPTLFVITAEPKDKVNPDAVEKVIYEELDKTKKTSISDEELQKAKNILLAGFYRSMKTINGKANTIGSYEVFFGDYHKLFNAADEFNKVTKEDVQRVATKYFGDKNRTVATLIPDPTDQKGANGGR